jgi:hypothetical protein
MNATFINNEFNTAATVTEISKGFAVSLIDCDSEEIVGTRIFPKEREADAIAYAKFLVQVI